MSFRCRAIATALVILALATGCGPAAPTATPVPAADTAIPATAAPLATDTAAAPPQTIPTPTPTEAPAADEIEVSGPRTLAGHSGAVTSLAFSPDGAVLASTGHDNTIYLWDVASGQVIQTLQGGSASVKSVDFGPDGNLLATVESDQTIALWDLATGQVLRRIGAAGMEACGLEISPDGTILASGHVDTMVRLWDVETGELVRTLSGMEGVSCPVAFSPDGALVASGGGNTDSRVLVWEVASGQLRHTLSGHNPNVYRVVFSPDGTLLASASGDRTAKIWDVDSGQMLHDLDADRYKLMYVAFSPDGRLLVSGGDDGLVRLWDVASGQLLNTLPGHGREIYAVAFSPVDLLFASAGEGGDVLLWRITSTPPPDEWRPAVSPSAQAGYTPLFEPAACRFDVPEGYQVECGDLVVPEDRSRPDGSTIRLHVATFKSSSPNPEPDPVIHLIGGPGGSLLSVAGLYLNAGGDEILEKRDYTLFDQRGTLYADPFLGCPGHTELKWELAGQHLSLQERSTRELEFFLSCHDDLLERGINLAAYNSAESAADVNDLRLALGYEQVNLYGISYGSRLALTVIRDYPEGIRSAIIDAVWPPQADLDHEVALSAHRALGVLFDACAADSHCSQTYPDLEATFYQVIRDLNASPISLQFSGGTVVVDGYSFLESIFGLMYSIDAIPLIPSIIDDASRGELLEEAFTVRDRSTYSWGMHYSVRCHEEMAFETQEQAYALAAGLPPELVDFFVGTFEFPLCASWLAGEADPVEDEPVVSGVPTLVLSGRFDPITPPAYGRAAAETLENGYFYEFPTLSHGAMRSNGCALYIGLQFLDDPTTEPDSSCMEQLSGPHFE